MTMDYFINLTGMVGFPEFDQMPLVRFLADRFLVNEETTIQDLQPRLHLDPFKLQSIKHRIDSQFQSHYQDRPKVYFHPQASTPIRNIPKKYADKIIQALIAQGFNVITAIPYGYTADEFSSVEVISNDVDDLLHIIECCDLVVSVGTVVYHLAAALNKPTILMPTVQADVNSGNELPQVNNWIPSESKNLILNKHIGRDEKDLEIAEKIWSNIDPIELSQELKRMFSIRK